MGGLDRDMFLKGIVGLVVGVVSIAILRLPTDALGVVVGIMFGLLAGVPVSLLILYSERQGRYDRPQVEAEWETPVRLTEGGRSRRTGTLPRVIVLDRIASDRVRALVELEDFGEPRP